MGACTCATFPAKPSIDRIIASANCAGGRGMGSGSADADCGGRTSVGDESSLEVFAVAVAGAPSNALMTLENAAGACVGCAVVFAAEPGTLIRARMAGSALLAGAAVTAFTLRANAVPSPKRHNAISSD